MDTRIYCYPPVADENSKILILGSAPSAESLKQGFYYAHPRNAFWKILSETLSHPLPNTIEEKKQLLLQNHIALWDVVASCEREGSLDQSIRAEQINDFDAFFRAHPDIQSILLNGGYAYRLFTQRASVSAGDRRAARLPSTSPAYVLPYAKKLEAWARAIREGLFLS